MRKKTIEFTAQSGHIAPEIVTVGSESECPERKAACVKDSNGNPESRKHTLDNGKFAAHNLARFWRETSNQLHSHKRLVAEGKYLEEAHDFCRYVLNSGMLSIFEASPQAFPLKVDAAFLRWQAEELTREIQDRYRKGKNTPTVEFSEIQSINRKLDLIAGQLAKVSNLPRQDGPELRIVESV
jgi:hypothetical protein